MKVISRAFFTAATVVFVSWAAQGAQAQSLFADAERMDELAVEMQDISVDINASMKETQEAIRKLLGEGGNPSVDAVRKYFDDLEIQARTILSQVSINSSFMDALDAADKRLGVMKLRFEADIEASGGDNKRAMRRLERIEVARAEFKRQKLLVRKTESDIVNLLLANSEARDEIIIDGSIEDAERVVAALGKVTSGLQAAADVLADVSTSALNREDISGIAIE